LLSAAIVLLARGRLAGDTLRRRLGLHDVLRPITVQPYPSEWVLNVLPRPVALAELAILLAAAWLFRRNRKEKTP